MLHHHTEEEHAPYVAPRPLPEHAPATAQEVAQAIVSIETRQQANAPAPTRTVTLQDTIRQLELTVTPEELLAELHAQRTATHQKTAMSPRRSKHPLSWWLMLSGLVLSTATTVFVSFLLYMMVKKYIELWQDLSARTSHRGLSKTTPLPLAPALRPLSVFKPHNPAFVSFKDLQALANGASPSHIMASQWSSGASGVDWDIELDNGRYMARVNSMRTNANAADKMEWVSATSSGVAFNYTESIPVERFKRAFDTRTVSTDSQPNATQVKILRGDE